jgi:hypothetical protein
MKPQDESKQYISQNPCSDYLKKAMSDFGEAPERSVVVSSGDV